MDVFGNELDEDGNSIDKFNKPIDIRNYFVTNGSLTKDPQRDQVYTKLLGDVILDKFMTGNTVYSSHMVAFVAFEFLKKRYNDSDIFTIKKARI